jgi:hypothetical protein
VKTGAYFKFPREFKMMLATIGDSQRRGETKKLFVQAQATYVENKNKRFKEKINLGDE